VVWNTVQAALPELLKRLSAMRPDAGNEDHDGDAMAP
jgi:hypothetical protein